MPPQNAQQNAAQDNAWPAAKEAEATHVSAGYRDALKFVLVPRTRIEFAAPDFATTQKIRSPGDLLIEVPVKGKAVNFPAGTTLNCDFAWLVHQDGAPDARPCPVGGAKLVIANDGTFEVKVGDKPPTIDVIAHKLITTGKLGYSLMPHFPHAATATFAPAIPFNNPCGVTVTKPEGDACRVGALVTFSPDFSTTLNKADLELRIVELDEGSSEVAYSPDRYVFSHRWGPSALWFLRNTDSQHWSIGFSNETCEHFADVGDEEEGGYEFGWQLWGRAREGAPQTLLLEDKRFLQVPRPRLEDFRVEYDKSWEGTWEVHGKISNVDPRAHLMVDVALVELPPPPLETPPATPLSPPKALTPMAALAPKTSAAQTPVEATPAGTRTPPTRLRLQPDGSFEAHFGERHWMSDWSSVNPAPIVIPKAYAILSLAATTREGKPGPIGPYLGFDDTKYSPFKGEVLTWDIDAPWVCSEEAASLLPARPPRPTRRRAGVTARPAPPVEEGDQKGSITWDEVWDDIVAWEAIVAFMYQDNRGNVTVGAGNLLTHIEPKKDKDLMAAQGLAFHNMDEGRPATKAEIAEAFNKVKNMAEDMVATRYATKPKIALPDPVIEELTKYRYDNEFLPALLKGYPQYNTYPRAARRGLFDVTYNVGISIAGTPSDKWKPFAAAVRARKWEAAAAECKKNAPADGDKSRAQWREDLFRYAARIDWIKPGT